MSTTQNKIQSKRFFIRKSIIGQNKIVEVTFKSGLKATYNHDQAYEAMKSKLDQMNCWVKYKSYTSSTNLPLVVRAISQ